MQKKLVVITGASSGIGAATAKAFSALGYPLLLLARRIDKLEALGLTNALCRQVDVADAKQLSRAIEEAENTFGHVDCIINNAGTMILDAISKQDPSLWQTMLNVNVMGVLNGIHSVLANMIKRKTGTIINIGSLSGRKTFANHAVYCGTKFAVHAISESIREELAPHNIRVITIAPGAVKTELLQHTTSEEIKSNFQEINEKIGGILSAETVVNAILFCYQQPQSVCIREVVLAVTKQN